MTPLQEALKECEIHPKHVVVLYYGNGETTEHHIFEKNPDAWGEKAKVKLKAESYHVQR